MKRAAPTGAIADRPTAPKRPRPRPRPRPALAPGVHLLAHQATLTYVPGAVPCARPEFDALFDAQPPPTPNPMNAKTFLRRRQGTFGATYRFGRQTSVNMGPVDAAPDVVRRCVDDARRRAGPDHAPKYTGAHVNWYPDGAAGLKAHQDATDPGPGAHLPIFSYSFLVDAADHPAAQPCRDFVVSHDKAQRDVAARVETRHGDLVVMAGAQFQRALWHAVPPTARKDKKHLRRVNVTVRPWAGSKTVRDAK